MSADVRLSLAAQAAYEMALRDLTLVQHSLTDIANRPYASLSVGPMADLCANESDAVRKAVSTLRAILNVAQQNAEKGTSDV